MLNHFISYLIQAGECSLPGLGTFIMLSQPSKLDLPNKEIFPPETHCQFSENTLPLPKKFIHYLSVKKEMEEKQAVEAFHAWCKELQVQMDSGKIIQFPVIGSLKKDESGNTVFTPENKFTYYDPLPALRVVHKEVNHSVLVGDKESNSSEMQAILNEEEVPTPNNSFWKIAAGILIVIGISLIFYHFYNAGSSNSLGNSTKINLKTFSNTYISK